MIPIADESPKGYIPFVNYILIAANLLLYFFWQQSKDAFFATYGLVPARLLNQPENPMGYFSFFTSMFMHGGIMHLLSNMLYLWIFGDNIEYTIGHRRYLLFYLLVGFAAGLGQVLTNPASAVPMVGASGAISGVLGAYLLKYPKNRVSILFFFFIFFKIVKIPALLVLSVWCVIQVISGLNASAETGGVAWFAHIGGFIAGFALIKIFEILPKNKR